MFWFDIPFSTRFFDFFLYCFNRVRFFKWSNDYGRFRIAIPAVAMIARGRAYWIGAGWVVCWTGAVVVVIAVVTIVARDVGVPVSVTRVVVGTVVSATVFVPIAYRFLSLLPT
jgi:hypothetical protein